MEKDHGNFFHKMQVIGAKIFVSKALWKMLVIPVTWTAADCKEHVWQDSALSDCQKFWEWWEYWKDQEEITLVLLSLPLPNPYFFWDSFRGEQSNIKKHKTKDFDFRSLSSDRNLQDSLRKIIL